MSDEKRIVSDEDAGLVTRCLGGDAEAFEDLVRRHEKKMVNIAFRVIGDYEESCEVVQDAFVSAYKNLGKFKGDASFSTWLCSIVLNLSRNRLRQMKSRRSREAVSIDNPLPAESGGISIDPPSSDPSALDELENKEMRRKIESCLGGLEAEFREAIVLRDMQGFSYGEISGMLGVPEGTVKSRIHRARDAMRECLKRVMGDFK